MDVLKWGLYAERPLPAEECSHALVMEIGFTDLDPENIHGPMISYHLV